MPLIKEINDSDYNTDTELETSLLIEEENEEVIQDALNAVIKFHLDGEGRSSLNAEVFKQLLLFILAFFGVILYFPPANEYAESICADPDYKNIPCDFFVINHVAGTLLVAGGILMSATNAFFDRKKAENIPFKLQNYLKDALTPKQKLAENAVTFAGSFVASIPFMIITAVNPIPNLPKVIIVLQSAIVGLTNTLLHLLPFKLALKNPLYRAPFLPLEFIFQTISNALLNEEEKQEKELQGQINLGYQMIKQRMIDHLGLAQRLLSIYGYRLTGCSYTNEIAKKIRDIKELDELPLKLLTRLLTCLHERSPNQIISPPGKLNNIFRKMLYFIGASWVILACSGFWGGTFNEMVELTKSQVLAAIFSALPDYCLMVLLAFFGGNALQNSYDYLTVWNDDTVKIPITFKDYLKTSVVSVMISMYLSVFSYAAGTQLINDNFNGKLEFLRPYLLELAKTGLTFLGFTAMIDFFSNVLSKLQQYSGNADTQTVANFYAALNQMTDSIQLMIPKLLLESLAQTDKDQIKIILNVKGVNDLISFSRSLIQLADTLKTKLIKEFKLIDKENTDEASPSELIYQLDNDQGYDVKKIDELLNFFNKEPASIKLALSLEEVCQAYKAACKIINKLDSVNLVNESGVFLNSINNGNSFFSSTRKNGYGSMESSSNTQASFSR
ncbi:hypothetical protein [Rickettsiella endosymbiont of Rhagonycha lignosa]|uniref:hypothetical protein n=1 Tax=Rickettsiella endosymbiont of Rhagonycha lignosa TaxID=3077937 RepID=UPI00313CAF98